MPYVTLYEENEQKFEKVKMMKMFHRNYYKKCPLHALFRGRYVRSVRY